MNAVPRDFVLAPMHDFAPERADETFRWVDFDRVPERLTGGVLGAERYSRSGVLVPFASSEQVWVENIDMYFLDSLDFLTSEALRPSFDMNVGKGGFWAQHRKEPTGQSPSRRLRSVWRRRENPNDWRRAVVPNSPKTLLVLLRDINPNRAEEVNARLDAQAHPILLSAPGVWAADRYEASELDLVSSPNQVALDHPQFMDVFFIATPEVVTGAQFLQAAETLQAVHADYADDLTIRGASVYVQRPQPWSVEAIVGPMTATR